ncbi:hypothetical protein [Edaphobacter aggregans]|nr:hypothetical protein [Edaphobacter aggregans]
MEVMGVPSLRKTETVEAPLGAKLTTQGSSLASIATAKGWLGPP